ncbi:hypothetical protein CCC_00849 [Paramagnetospirillum magnetotacticum MS-1]|uniref:Methyltransferase domain-containing protein n=2 Tax=Paramagnetospirillum magnetotacticum TaxID=188 RepID=A0A0C2YRM9_PARME|nr:hypothetical protein CCC_00849 [Paramagnetospirillum magnetotacticum MS-1]
MVDRYVRPWPGAAILDIGCGPGTILDVMPEGVSYLGLDRNSSYIEEARRRYGSRGTFLEQDVTDLPAAERSFDLVMAFGLLHHVDDDGARAVMTAVSQRLRPGGRLITLDPVFVDGQSAMARWIAANDRGRFVRSPEGYRSLAETALPAVTVEILHDLLRIPFSSIVMICGTGDQERP